MPAQHSVRMLLDESLAVRRHLRPDPRSELGVLAPHGARQAVGCGPGPLSRAAGPRGPGDAAGQCPGIKARATDRRTRPGACENSSTAPRPVPARSTLPTAGSRCRSPSARRWTTFPSHSRHTGCMGRIRAPAGLHGWSERTGERLPGSCGRCGTALRHPCRAGAGSRRGTVSSGMLDRRRDGGSFFFDLMDRQRFKSRLRGPRLRRTRAERLHARACGAVRRFGRHLPHTRGELRATVARLLADPGERHERAAPGRALVLAKHTFRRRIDALLEAVTALSPGAPLEIEPPVRSLAH